MKSIAKETNYYCDLIEYSKYNLTSYWHALRDGSLMFWRLWCRPIEAIDVDHVAVDHHVLHPNHWDFIREHGCRKCEIRWIQFSIHSSPPPPLRFARNSSLIIRLVRFCLATWCQSDEPRHRISVFIRVLSHFLDFDWLVIPSNHIICRYLKPNLAWLLTPCRDATVWRLFGVAPDRIINLSSHF